jgi:preprotein translocase subunit SecG
MWLVYILTFILVIVCVFLSLLILAQKPKKDTGGGLAFGGAATDALFGAGSGDLFTKMTKYFTVAFFVLVLFLSVLSAQQSKRKVADPRAKVTAADKQADAVAAAAATTPAATATTSSTSAPAKPTTTSTSAPAAGLLLGKTNPPAATPAAPKPEAEKK